LFLKAVSHSVDVTTTRRPSHTTTNITPSMDEHVGTKPETTNIGKNTLNFRVRVMVFNATFNNISAIWWWSVLLMEETGVPGENHRSVASR